MQAADSSVNFSLFLTSGANQLARGKQQDNCLRVGHPVNQARKLLGLVHGFWKLSRGFLKMDLPSKGGRSNDVLDVDNRIILNVNAPLSQFLNHGSHRFDCLLLRFGAGTYHLPGAENERRGLGNLESKDKARELIGMIFYVGEGSSYLVEINFLIDAC